MIHNQIAATDKKSLANAVRTFYVIVLATIRDSVPDSIRPHVQEWALGGTAFAKQFGLTHYRVCLQEIAKHGFATEDSLVALGNELRSASKDFTAEHDISRDFLDMLSVFATWARTRSERAYSTLEKLVSRLEEPDLTREFVKEVGSQKPVDKALRLVVKKLVGADSNVIPMDLAQKAKTRSPELYKEYLRLRRQYNTVWKDALAAHVRDSGQKTVEYDVALYWLEQLGLEHTLPKDFDGRIDDQGRLYTHASRRINGVPGPMFPTVEMNPAYDANKDDQFVFVTRQADGNLGGYFYTVDYRKGTTEKKFTNVADLKDKIKGVRNKWLPMLKKNDNSLQSVAAAVLETLLQFSARIGTPGNAAEGQDTFGISTLRLKHVAFQPNGNVIIRYRGKDGVPQKHLLERTKQPHKWVIDVIAKCMQDKGPKDLLWTGKAKTGREIKVTAIVVNKLFKALGAGTVTVHKLRTLRGTVMFSEAMEKHADRIFNRKTPLTERQAREIFVKLAEEVGKQLGHVRSVAGGTKVTGATALASYIDPAVQKEFWDRLGMRAPRAVEKHFV